MLTQFVSPPAHRPKRRLKTPLTTWKHLAIVVKDHAVPGLTAGTTAQDQLEYMADVYVPMFARQVDEYSRGRCTIDLTVLVPTNDLNSATSLGGGNWYVHPNDLKSSGIWAEGSCNDYDSVSVYTHQTYVPTPSYAGNTVGFWAATSDPGVSHMDQLPAATGAAFAASDSIQVHEWSHQVESWFESPEGGSYAITDVHGAEFRIDPRTGAVYNATNNWWEWHQDMLSGMVSSGANLPGITDAIWASGRPNT
jgi:hypothetical protein